MNDESLSIDVHNLRKSFNGRIAVDGISLQVKKGEIYGFLGPNGSGKTTSLRMICGLIAPDAAEGTCLGYNIESQSQEIKKHVGYMTQSFTLYNELTVYENLDFVARLYSIKNREAEIQQTLKEFDLDDRKNQLAGTLSGGLKQKMSLAAALIHKPQLLLLDEPTAGVDPKTRREFWSSIHRFSAEGITTLVTTHYMDEADRCNRLAFILRGKILVRGTYEEILKEVNLHTWQIITKHPYAIQEELKNYPEMSAVIFGNQIHVTGHDNTLIAEKLKNLKTPVISCNEITPGIEDIFITLVEEHGEKK